MANPVERMILDVMGSTKGYIQSWRFYFYYYIAVCPSLGGMEP